MATKLCLYSFCSIFFIISISTIAAAAAAPAAPIPPADIKNVYIVYLRASNEGRRAQHLSILRKVVGSEAESRIIYSYQSFNAFAATLTDKERDKLSKLGEVAFVTEDRVYRLEPNPQFPKSVTRPAHPHTPKYGFNHRPILP